MGVLFRKAETTATPEVIRNIKPFPVLALPNKRSIREIRLKCSFTPYTRKISKKILRIDSLEKALSKSVVKKIPDNKKISTATKNKNAGRILSNNKETINAIVTAMTIICCMNGERWNILQYYLTPII